MSGLVYLLSCARQPATGCCLCEAAAARRRAVFLALSRISAGDARGPDKDGPRLFGRDVATLGGASVTAATAPPSAGRRRRSDPTSLNTA